MTLGQFIRKPIVYFSTIIISAFTAGWQAPEELRKNAKLIVVSESEYKNSQEQLKNLQDQLKRLTDKMQPAGENSYSKRFYGTFRDIDEKGEPYFGQENVALTFTRHPDAPVEFVKGSAQGQVIEQNGQKINRIWELTGYRVADCLVLSYFTSSETNGGYGVYFFKKRGTAYNGYWLGKEALSGTHVKSPYVLTTEEISTDNLIKTYPILGNKCEEVNFGEPAPPIYKEKESSKEKTLGGIAPAQGPNKP
ncbi:MAG: hypothetical protein V4726_09090 [Verrucomicrobiota bacterium]